MGRHSRNRLWRQQIMNDLEQILKQKATPDIVRYAYRPYKMDHALSVFKKLGEQKINKEFVIDRENEWVIKNIIRWAHGDQSIQAVDPETRTVINGDLTKGIYLSGGTGTGKSLVLEILTKYLTIDNVKALFLGANIKFLVFPYYTTNKVCSYYAEFGDLNPFLYSPIICFQDLGVEQQETLFMGTRTKVMQQIIQERGDTRGLITLFSSNNRMLDPETYNLYGDRGVSRLRKMCNYYELKGSDRRY